MPELLWEIPPSFRRRPLCLHIRIYFPTGMFTLHYYWRLEAATVACLLDFMDPQYYLLL